MLMKYCIKQCMLDIQDIIEIDVATRMALLLDNNCKAHISGYVRDAVYSPSIKYMGRKLIATAANIGGGFSTLCADRLKA